MEQAYCCMCRKNVPERKSAAYCLDGERGLGIRSSLLYYLRRNADKKWAA